MLNHQCEIEGCVRTATHRKGTVCSMHDKRIRRRGDASITLPPGPRSRLAISAEVARTIQRFEDQVIAKYQNTEPSPEYFALRSRIAFALEVTK